MVAVAWSLTAGIFVVCIHMGMEGSTSYWLRREIEEWIPLASGSCRETSKLLVWIFLGGFFWFAASLGVQRKWHLER